MSGTPLENFMQHLGPAKRSGKEYAARCPAHDDRSPSLTFCEGDDKRVLVQCKAGCSTEDVVAAMGLTMADLFTERDRDHNRQRTIIAIYDYTDADGVLLFQAVRYSPKGFSQRHPDGAGGYVNNMQGVRRVLYGLPAVKRAIAAGDVIFVCEGEKDADAVAAREFVATCNAMGAGKWRDEYTEQLAGAHEVAIIADNDEVGRKHARAVAAALAGHVGAVSVWRSPTEHDAADHLGSGLGMEDLVPLEDDDDGRELPDIDAFLAETEDEGAPVIAKLLHEGERVILTGTEGAGKSTLLRQVGVMASAGLHPFTGEPIPPINVTIFDYENSRRHTRNKLRPLRELLAHDYDPTRLRIEVAPRGINLLDADDAAAFRAMVAKHAPRLLIVGPIYKMAESDPRDEREARQVAKLFDAIREEVGCALIIEAHSPYAVGKGQRETRPFGASLWSRWPEFGLHITEQGFLKRWRGDREESDWPKRLHRGETWPWEQRDGPEADEESEPGTWRPTTLMDRVSRKLESFADDDLPSRTALVDAVRGNRRFKFTAIDYLIEDGFAEKVGTKIRSVKPYRDFTAGVREAMRDERERF